jgi:hypothetical protein
VVVQNSLNQTATNGTTLLFCVMLLTTKWSVLRCQSFQKKKKTHTHTHTHACFLSYVTPVSLLEKLIISQLFNTLPSLSHRHIQTHTHKHTHTSAHERACFLSYLTPRSLLEKLIISQLFNTLPFLSPRQTHAHTHTRTHTRTHIL